ncbi:PBS lyase HEAT domain protein repeat-containing protein [Thalassoporum mexicanum PCC 7367]|uniref:HEAT repeat domain-containing protein n=1 Tax=Thalassoporum mexicanum TaxID=3457544 RepID=UPI00029FC4E8|nr:HEAT repeat domain-containing protein [Pseudanabaena sp. PCC 7367]AFY70648.1 PBS lyase HEAT domain protein repeat-containing protein [Pseudanabaena sp. PCC 7367]
MSDEYAPSIQIALTVEQAIANLSAEDYSQRYYAAWWLGKLRAKEALEPLLAALNAEEESTELGGYPLKRNAARALGELKEPSAIPALIEALGSDDYYLREAAVVAIEAIASVPQGLRAAQACIPALSQLLPTDVAAINSLKQQPYEAILKALGRLKARSAEDLVRLFLGHRTDRIRFAAFSAMYGITEQTEYAEQLVIQLKNPDLSLRRIALANLGQLGYLPAAEAIAQAEVEDSFKLAALKELLNAHLPNVDYDLSLSEPLQQIMLWMDDLL